MRNLARILIAAERRESTSADVDSDAAVRVCVKLQECLSPLAGAVGFRTLLTRALALAKAEVPSLTHWKIGPAGQLLNSVGGESDNGGAEKGGVALVAHLLELLVTFIGEALTRRIVRQIWPKTALDTPKSVGKT